MANSNAILCQFLFLIVLLIALVGCSSNAGADAKRSLAQQEPSRREIIGQRLYLRYCSSCHGESGEGDGLHAYTLNPPPANHADSLFMNALSDEYLFDVISKGGASVGKSPEMPRWKDVLNKNEIENVIIFIRTLSQRQKSPAGGGSSH